MAAPSLSQPSLVQVPKPSLLTPKTKTLHAQNSPLFPQHNYNQLSLKTRNGFVPKASFAPVPVPVPVPVQSNSNSNSAFPTKKSDNPIIVIDNYDSFTYNLCQVCPKFISLSLSLLFLCLFLLLFVLDHVLVNEIFCCLVAQKMWEKKFL